VKLTRVAIGSVVAVALLSGGLTASSVSAAHGDNNTDDSGAAPCGVAISGGTVMNETVIDISADGGTAITDASGGSNNLATTGGGNATTDIASSGNGGVATAGANGGAVSLGDINSGGNAGNAISVGDTHCNAAAPAAEEAAPVEAAAEAEVVALPSTGVGFGDASSLFALLASAGAGVTALGLRRR